MLRPMGQSRAKPWPTLGRYLGEGSRRLAINCRGFSCYRISVVDLTTVPENRHEWPLNQIEWGCPHCGSAMLMIAWPTAKEDGIEALSHAELLRLTKSHRLQR